MNYYQKRIEEIEVLVKEHKYKDAESLIEEELRMPYIPQEIEEKLHSLYKDVRSELHSASRIHKHVDSDIEALLFGSVDEACIACEMLKDANVRKYLDIIERYLENNPHYIIRTLLVETLIEQDITSEIKMDYEGMDITFIPRYVASVKDSEPGKQAIEKLLIYFENENPVFAQMCIETLVKELYLKLPFTVVEDEVEYLVVAIIGYVFKANSDEEGYTSFIKEKNLAKYMGYDLLLYKYDI